MQSEKHTLATSRVVTSAFSGPELTRNGQTQSGKVCCGLVSPHFGQKRKNEHPNCYQHKVEKAASVMVWGCVSANGMHACDGTVRAERYILLLERHMLPSEQCFLQECHRKVRPQDC